MEVVPVDGDAALAAVALGEGAGPPKVAPVGHVEPVTQGTEPEACLRADMTGEPRSKRGVLRHLKRKGGPTGPPLHVAIVRPDSSGGRGFLRLLRGDALLRRRLCSLRGGRRRPPLLRRLRAELLREPLHTALGVDQLLAAGKE